MIGLIAAWVVMATWSEARGRPRGRLRDLRRPAAAGPTSIRWPGSVTRFLERFDLAPPARIGTKAGVGLALGLVAAASAPQLTVVGVVGAVAIAAGRARARRWHRADRLQRALPETLDLLGLAVRAGLVPTEALVTASRTSAEPLDEVLGAAVVRLRRGGSWDEVVAQMGRDLGPDGRGLELLLGGESGAPLADGIDRLAAELRDRRRREIQRRAQRLPIAVLAPLVTCILPAFLLITIVPLVSTLGGDVIQDLPLGATP